MAEDADITLPEHLEAAVAEFTNQFMSLHQAETNEILSQLMNVVRQPMNSAHQPRACLQALYEAYPPGTGTEDDCHRFAELSSSVAPSENTFRLLMVSACHENDVLRYIASIQDAERNYREEQGAWDRRQAELAQGNGTRVIVCVRPGQGKPTLKISEDKNHVTITVLGSHPRDYTVDKLFASDQGIPWQIEHVSRYIDSKSPTLDQLLSGRVLTVLVYGRSGTGKSRLLLQGRNKEDLGDGASHEVGEKLEHSAKCGPEDSLIHRTLTTYLDAANERFSGTSMTLVPIEICDGKARTILGTRERISVLSGGRPVIRQNGASTRDVEDFPVNDTAALANILKRLQSSRTTAATKLNKDGSSRSHLVLKFEIQVPVRAQRARIVFVDLAGNESIGDLSNDTVQQGKAIVSDLHALRMDIQEAKTKGRLPVPHRELSKILNPFLVCADIMYIGTIAEDEESRTMKGTLDHVETAMSMRTNQKNS